MKRLILLLLVVVSGCSSEMGAVQERYLLLAENKSQIVQSHYPVLLVNTELADYLNQRHIVYRTSDTQVVYAKNHQWAQDLSQQLTYWVINDLRMKDIPYWPVELSSFLKPEQSSQLTIRFHQFNGAFSGNAEVSGEWLITDIDGNLERNESFYFEIPLKEDGYDALVEALTEGLQQLSSEIQESI